MSQTPPASLEDYPGYFPPIKKSFWTRVKVGALASVVGLLVGVGVGGGETPEEPRADSSDLRSATVDVEAEIDEAVAELVTEHEAELSAQESRLVAAVTAAEKAAKKAARAEIRQVKQAAERARKRAVQQAVQAERDRQQEVASPPDQNVVDTSTDPRFSYCYEANAAGYGPYRRGSDPEYDWYQDRDNDGIVCE